LGANRTQLNKLLYNGQIGGFYIFQNLKKLATYYTPYKGLLAANLVSTVFVAALALALPILVRHVTGTVIELGGDNVIGEIIRIGAVMLAIIIAQTGFAIFYAYKGHDMGAKIERDMRGELFGQYQKLPFSFYDNQKIGQLMTRLSNDLNGLSEMMHHTPENIVMYGIQFIGALIILFAINWQLAFIVCIPVVLMVAYSFPFYRKMQKVKKENREILGNVSSFVQENLSGIKVIKSFANEGAEIAKFKKENANFYTSHKQIYKYEALNFEPIQFFFRPLITIVIVTAGGIWITMGELALTDLLIFVMYAAYLTEPIPQLAFMVEQVQDGLIGYGRFREIMDTVPDIQDAENAAILDSVKGDVHFANVAFRYSADGDAVLNHINLTVKQGETIAIVGRSGIGKTTLCSLIPRFYDVSMGSISIDGKDIRAVTQESLRKQIGVVRQETFLFAGTIMENILYGNLSCAEQDAIEAAKKANAHEFIINLPDGYNTDIGQRGVKLSGGQQQRISIARVFLKNPPILIFDEATSSLDYESEKAVMESLTTLAKGRTAFIIAHRLSTIQNADRIIVLEKDGIVEEGTHKELCAAKGVYAQLYNSQN